jgi:hypothetical protein
VTPDDRAPGGAMRALRLTWWIVCPAFLVVVLVFIRERACFDRHYLLPAVSTKPLLAWLIAGIYLAAHGWLVAAYGMTVARTGTLLPRPAQARAIWGGMWLMLLAMLTLFVLENAPGEVWAKIARITGCGG